MGFVPRRAEYKLDFAGTGFAGLEVTTRSASLDVLFAILELAGPGGDGPGLASVSRTQAEALFGMFARVLVSWNVETGDGRPVPATRDGLLSQDPEFVMAVIEAWSAQMTAHRQMPAAAAPGDAAAAAGALQLAGLPGAVPGSSQGTVPAPPDQEAGA